MLCKVCKLNNEYQKGKCLGCYLGYIRGRDGIITCRYCNKEYDILGGSFKRHTQTKKHIEKQTDENIQREMRKELEEFLNHIQRN